VCCADLPALGGVCPPRSAGRGLGDLLNRAYQQRRGPQPYPKPTPTLTGGGGGYGSYTYTPTGRAAWATGGGRRHGITLITALQHAFFLTYVRSFAECVVDEFVVC